MRIALVLVVVASALLSVARTSAQVPSPAATSLDVSPRSGDALTVHAVRVAGLNPGAPLVLVVFDPTGQQTVTTLSSDAAGNAQITLTPPVGGWNIGMYRVVAALSGERAISTTFAANDGGRHLIVGPDLPSPNSALVVSGLGLPPDTQIDLVLTVAGGLGIRQVTASTDAQGQLTVFLWPQAMGFDFFSAGRYELSSPALDLDTSFFIREHPSTSFISIRSPLSPSDGATLHFSAYAPGRFIWVVYATPDGRSLGEFLLGPADARGEVNATVRLPALAPGQYLMATPYDWGETAFTIAAPTPTSTPTPAPTATLTPAPTHTPTPVATRTPRPTATHVARPRPTATRHGSCKRTKKHKKPCTSRVSL